MYMWQNSRIQHVCILPHCYLFDGDVSILQNTWNVQSLPKYIIVLALYHRAVPIIVGSLNHAGYMTRYNDAMANRS